MLQIERDIRNFLIENLLFGQDDGLTNDTSFIEAGIIDSMSVVELIEFLGKRYGVEVNDDELIPDNLDSIRNLRCFIERKLAARQTAEPTGVIHAG